MKLWVDDIRPKPDDTWVLATCFLEATLWLYAGGVEVISLDHDLGEGMSGYDVARWMVGILPDGPPSMPHWPKDIYVHSRNPVGWQNIVDLLKRYAPVGVRVHTASGPP